MARVVLICWRDATSRTRHPVAAQQLSSLLARLTPDNITAAPAKILGDPNLLVGVLHAHQLRSIEGSSVCLGVLHAPAPGWWEPGSAVPDGSYALFRSDARAVELATDIVASRT